MRYRAARCVRSTIITTVLVGCGFATGAEAQQADSQEAEVVAVVDAFHASLAAGDSIAALDYLADDVAILESGGMEDKAHYRSGHLAGDIRFAQAIARRRGDIEVRVVGEVAWATSSSVTEGQMGERMINSQGVELMVLVRDAGAWKIRAIHWSSRARR
jgi:ketosteroid isomerase-like protein